MSSAQPVRLRFGFHSGQQYQTIAEVAQIWGRIDRLGYDWISCFEHWRPLIGGEDGPCLDSTVTLASAGRSTTRATLALMVSPAHVTNPGLLAMRAVALQEVLDGRFVLGLGAGADDAAYGAFGINLPELADRVRILEETIPSIRALMRGESVTNRGFYQLESARIVPSAAINIPIAVGASGPRMLRIAGRHADIWNTLVDAPEQFERQLAIVRDAARAVGRRIEDVRPSITFRAAIGSSAAISKQRALVEEHASSDLREYVSWGTSDACVSALLPYVKLGCRDFVFAARPPLDWLSIRAFISEVAPKLRGV